MKHTRSQGHLLLAFRSSESAPPLVGCCEAEYIDECGKCRMVTRVEGWKFVICSSRAFFSSRLTTMRPSKVQTSVCLRSSQGRARSQPSAVHPNMWVSSPLSHQYTKLLTCLSKLKFFLLTPKVPWCFSQKLLILTEFEETISVFFFKSLFYRSNHRILKLPMSLSCKKISTIDSLYIARS